MKNFEKIINKINEKVFYGAAWLIYPLILVIMYEVVRRYFFSSPTNWVYDMTWMIFGSFIFLGGAYCLHTGGHVKADIIYNLLTDKGKALLDLISYLVFYFPMMGFLCYSSYTYFIKALMLHETSSYTSWQPVVWPAKLIMLFSIAMLLLQGIVQFYNSVKPLFNRKGGSK